MMLHLSNPMADEQISLFSLDQVATPATQGEPASTAPTDPEPAQYEAIPTTGSVAIPPGTYASLEDLATHCNACQRCDLAPTRTNVVVSRGSATAPIFIIGEGPGQQEDEQGKPFVGRSGQLLEQILASVRLDTERDVYIGNIVKCRPPTTGCPPPTK